MAEPIPITNDDAERRKHLTEVWARYDGDHPDSVTNEWTDRGVTVDDNVTVNDLATVVDTGVDFLVGSGQGELEIAVMVPVAAAGQRADQDDDATLWLDRVWRFNKRRTFLRKLGTSGAVAGRFAMKIVPATKPGGAVVDPEGMHRVVVLDPLALIVRHDPRDVDTVIAYAIDTIVTDDAGTAVGRQREQHTRRDDGTGWDIDYFVLERPMELSPGTIVAWKRDPARSKTVLWPHPFAAIVDGQNLPAPHAPWGRSDLSDDILHLQASINRIATNETRTLRLFAHPIPYGTVGEGGEPSVAAQGVQDASIGAMRWYPHGSSIDVIPVHHEGLEASASFREDLTDKLYEVARTPRIAAGKVDDLGAISGVAILILYRPLIAKTETKRDTYGDAIVELCQRLLVISGKAKTVVDLDVVLGWPDVLPKDRATEVETAVSLRRDLNVSERTVYEGLGIPWEQEKERRAEEDADPMEDEHGTLGAVEDISALLDVDGRGVPQEPGEAA